MGTVLIIEGRVEEGMRLLEETHKYRKKILGEEHPDTLKTLGCIAEGLETHGQFQESLQTWTKIYESRKIVLGENHPLTINTQQKMERLSEM